MTAALFGDKAVEGPAFFVEGAPPLAYGELRGLVREIAATLPSRELFFLVGSNDIPTLACYLAALNCGAVPLLLASDMAAEQLNRLIQTYDPPYIFMPDDVFRDSADVQREWSRGGYTFFRRRGAKSPPLHDDLALLLATSGSTGSPKLVRLSLRNIVANADSIVRYLDINVTERAITSLPFNYSYGLSVINSHLRAGASLVLTNRSLMDKVFWQLLRDYRATSFAGVPYSYDILLKLRFEQIDMPSIKTLTQAGGRLDPVKIRRVDEICRRKNIRFFSMYGQTEATARIAFLAPDEIESRLGSIGKAIPGGRLWIEDENGQHIDSPDLTGELVYSGANVSLGYADCPNDLALGDVNLGVLHTGDLARMDADGYFFIEGRKRRFLKIFGVRISLDAVEQIGTGKGWKCAAHGVDDKLVLFVAESPHLQPNGMRAEMAACLSVHSSAIDVRLIPELPRLNTGKVDYQCLSQMI